MSRLFLLLALLAGFIPAPCQHGTDEAGRLYYAYDSAWQAGDFVGSEYYLSKILESGFKLPDLNWAVVHKALGLVLYETGDYLEALNHYRLAQDYYNRSGARSPEVLIKIHNNFGLLFNWLGESTRALDHYEEAIRLLDSIPSEGTGYASMLSMVQLNRGVSLYRLEKYQDALENLKQSERLKEEHGLAYLASVYFNLARVYQQLGSLKISEEYYLKSIERWIAEHDSGYYQLANIYLNFGQFLSEKGDRDRGLIYLKKALEGYLQSYGHRHPLTAGCYEMLSLHHIERDDMNSALEFIQQALISASSSFNEMEYYLNPDPASALHKLTLMKILATKARVLEDAAGRVTDGTDYLKAGLMTNQCALELLHRIQESYMSQESRIYLTSRQKGIYTTGLRLNLKMYRNTGHHVYKENAFLLAASGKTNELLFEMKMKEWLYMESLPDSLVIQVTEWKEKADLLVNLIENEKKELIPDSSNLAHWQEQLFRTRDYFNRKMQQMRLEYPQISQFELADPALSMESIRSHLKRNRTLLEYYVCGEKMKELFLFVVTRKTCDFYHTILDTTFYSDLEVMHQHLHRFNPFRENILRYDSLKVALSGLYRQLVQPVDSLIEGKELVISPDEELATLPFDALITRYETENRINYAGLPFLLHKYHISYLYNSMLINSQWKERMWFPGITAWVPEYRGNAGSGREILAGASEEVREVLEIARGSSFRGDMPKERITDILEQKGIIHLAMHAHTGIDRGGSPYFLLSSRDDSIFTNRLHDFEITAMKITSPMVVLSGCETAGGKLLHGEGIISLSRGFLQAGAGSVVHSLWPLEDLKGSVVMELYYSQLKRGISKSSAMAIAKKQYLSTQPPSYTHPYYWSAYQVTGDPSPLVMKGRYGIFVFAGIAMLLVIYYLIRRNFFASV